MISGPGFNLIWCMGLISGNKMVASMSVAFCFSQKWNNTVYVNYVCVDLHFRRLPYAWCVIQLPLIVLMILPKFN